MTREKCNSKSNSFVAAAEQVCLQPVLEHRQRRGRRNIAWQAIRIPCMNSYYEDAITENEKNISLPKTAGLHWRSNLQRTIEGSHRQASFSVLLRRGQPAHVSRPSRYLVDTIHSADRWQASSKLAPASGPAEHLLAPPLNARCSYRQAQTL